MDDTGANAGSAIPQRIGPFRVLSQIGQGGMGVVYLAEETEPVLRRVAVKVVRDDRQGREFLARFEMERRALERMEHPNIARVLGAGVTADGRPWFAMEHVAGLPVDEYCDKRRLSIDERLRLFGQICAGVQHAHTKGIMHRDLKPGNILVTEVDDRPLAKIIDFGLARAIELHGQRATLFEELRRVIGTLAYMSPEQAGLDSEGLDARTDVYSLGVLLYELLTGRLPFDSAELERAGVLGCQQIIREREPVRPSTHFSQHSPMASAQAELRRSSPRTLWRKIAGELEWIVMRALHKERSHRYMTVRDFGRDIDAYLQNRPVEAGPPSVAYRLRKWVARHRAGAAIAGIIVVGLAVGLVVAADLAATRARLLQATRETLLAGDPLLGRELEQEANDDLWPAMPALVEELDRWLGQAQDLVLRAPEQRQLATTLAPDGGDAARARRIAEHLERVGAFTAPDGLLRRVAERRREAATIVHRTVAAPEVAARWAAAGARMRASDRYAAFGELVPQVGLVPIGVDPDSRLEEFAVLQSGEVPAAAGAPPREADAIVLVLIPGGQATIGAVRDGGPHRDPDAARNEGPVQTVRLDPYFLGKHEMTQAQWWRATGDFAATFRPDPHYDSMVTARKLPAAPTLLHPVETVKWTECVAVLRRLDLVLPTEAQWEHAARGGTATPWFCCAEPGAVLGSYANLADAYAARWQREQGIDVWPDTAAAAALSIDDGFLMSAPIGRLGKNGFGLHDVHGNVWEWCRDAFDDGNYGFGLRDGDGACLKGDDWSSVVRGGSFATDLRYSRVSHREKNPRDSRWATHGLRAARDYRPPLRGS